MNYDYNGYKLKSVIYNGYTIDFFKYPYRGTNKIYVVTNDYAGWYSNKKDALNSVKRIINGLK